MVQLKEIVPWETQKQKQIGKKKYLHIYQSFGNTYRMPFTVTKDCSVIALGSTGCRTCVCVFVELSDTDCFAAHISAADYDACSAEQVIADNRAQWIPDEHKAQGLVDAILGKLRETPGLLKQVHGGTFAGEVKRTVVLCPHKVWGGEPAMGTFIIEALGKFFGVDMQYHQGHGFIADSRPDGWSVEILGWKNRYPGPSESDTEFYNWVDHDELVEEHGWTCANCAHPDLHDSGGWSFKFTKDGGWAPYEKV